MRTLGTRTDRCRECRSLFDQPRKQGRPRTLCDRCTSGAGSTVVLPTTPKPLGFVPKPDPPVRADGKCAVCPKQRKITAQAKKYAGEQLELDPFCSTECARKFHGCELASVQTDEQAEASTAGGRAMSERLTAERGWEDPYESEDVAA